VKGNLESYCSKSLGGLDRRVRNSRRLRRDAALVPYQVTGFCDEGIYIDLASQVLRGDLFQPLHDGKLLHVWVIALIIPWASDPLWGARAVTVVGDGLALYACYGIGSRLYDRRAGCLCAILYVICPFTLFHDRVALADGLMASFAGLALLWSIALVQDNKTYHAWLLGMTMAGSILFKIPGLLTLITPVVTAALIAKRPLIARVRQLALPYAVAFAVTALPVVRFLQSGGERSRSIFGESLQSWKAQFLSNFQTAWDWLWFYWTPPILIVGIAGLVIAILRRKREHLLLCISSFIPIFAFIAVSKIWFPRYLLPATVPALALAAAIVTPKSWAAGLARTGRATQSYVLSALPSVVFLVLVGFFSWRVDWLLLTTPASAPLLAIERVQYVEAWPSGYGVVEAADYLRQVARTLQGDVLAVHHDLGDGTHVGLKTYLMNEPRIKVEKLNLNNWVGIQTLVARSRAMRTFVVLNRPPVSDVADEQPDIVELLKVAELVQSYPKPGARASVDLYRVRSR
jgi:hypothetical protein